MKEINDKFEEFENDRKQKEKEINDLKSEVESLKKRLDETDQQLDRQEQYSRRNCLLVHGINELDNEDTDNLVIKNIKDLMNEEIVVTDIDRSHRLGKKKVNGKARPIIIKFTRYNVRNRIYRNKKKLKGKGISITESLTVIRMKHLNAARETHEFKNVWTQDGRIMFYDTTDSKIKVFYD